MPAKGEGTSERLFEHRVHVMAALAEQLDDATRHVLICLEPSGAHLAAYTRSFAKSAA
jgi:hypothetical protein